jgi:2-polyprenyl-3-methyl-5-hydroxy-6-metoxy-1,4-benzoquinol methylase
MEKQKFVEKVLGDTSATLTTFFGAIGDKLGLFKDLANKGPATSQQLATRTGLNERYLREWLGGMTTAGYLEYDPVNHSFSIPSEHIPALAQENSDVFFGGVYQMMPSLIGTYGELLNSFRNGGGISQASYDLEFWDGMERFTNGWFENLLTQQWIPAMPDVKSKLEKGARVADLGCGRGRALIKLAQTFPNSTFIGFDAFGPSIERARENARRAEVENRVSFQQLDVTKGLPEKYDLITTFDVIHDAADPSAILQTIRNSLRPDGIYFCLDINCSDKLEENSGPLGALFHGFSVFYCMTTSLAQGGAGLGTLGFHESKVRELCSKAGFTKIHRIPLDDPFNNVYEIRP